MKSLQNQKADNMKYPFILVLKENGGDSYYLMEEAKDLRDFALSLLTERYNADYYIKPEPVADTFEGYFMAVHNMTLDAAKKLARDFGGTVKIGNRSAANEIVSMKNAYAYACADAAAYNEIERAVNARDEKAALKIIYNRSCEGYQYEEFSMERIENLKPTK